MSAHPKPIVGVLGGTGNQGGSVVNALMKDGNYKMSSKNLI